MARELLMGNAAIGLGAIKAGVNLVSGYPGTPSTEIWKPSPGKTPAIFTLNGLSTKKQPWR